MDYKVVVTKDADEDLESYIKYFLTVNKTF